jgi:methylene-fatty-acyl-phospholipid synthase
LQFGSFTIKGDVHNKPNSRRINLKYIEITLGQRMTTSTGTEWTNEPTVWLTAFLIVFNPCLWNFIGRFEYNTKGISKVFGTKTGVYLAAAIIFSLGIVRDFLFELAIQRTGKNMTIYNNLVLRALGYVLAGTGWVFVISSMWRLGIVGTYLGDYFGILFDRKITDFPFSVVDHPMYQGATMAFLGTAVVQGSIVGVGLASLAGAVYTVASCYEGPFTAMIYSKRPQKAPSNGRRKRD